MRAATGIQLKQSTKDFQILEEYLFLPKLRRVVTFLVEAVDAGDWSWLVVASEYEHAILVLDFESIEQAYGLNTLPSPIDIIAQEQVVGFWGKSSVLEHPQQIGVLAMYISAYSHGCGHFHQHILFHKYVLDQPDNS